MTDCKLLVVYKENLEFGKGVNFCFVPDVLLKYRDNSDMLPVIAMMSCEAMCGLTN